jgi:hypothetical protein
MGGRLLTKRFPAFAVVAVVSLLLSSVLAQDQATPLSDETSFDVEPPLLVKPWEQEPGSGNSQENPKTPRDAAMLARLLEQAKKDAAYDARLVKTGVLSKVEAEQQALYVIRLESELANAQMIAAQERVTAEKARLSAGETTEAQVDAAIGGLSLATAAAKAAQETYYKAQLDAATLNLRRQRQLLALGSARKSDVARAEEKLAQLQQNVQPPR